MSGISSTLSIASQALTAQQYAISVTGQNISNVDNETYTRQVVTMATNGSVKISGLVFGTGTTVDQITGVMDDYLETSLFEKNSILAAYEEMELYLSNIETIIGTDSDSGLNSLLSEFWNAWSDLSDNPAGDAERVLVYESAKQLAEQFNSIDQALLDISVNIESDLGTGISQVNGLCSEIASLNVDIVALEASGASANDLRDQRSALYAELTDLIGCTSFEESNGSLSILTAEGYPLVSADSTHTLTYSSGRITWEGSAGTVDITDIISGGKIDGWLTLRDELIPEYQAELDSLAEELIYQVNFQCSQGAGETYYSDALTSTYATDSSGLLSTLDYANRIDTSSDLVLWLSDDSGSSTAYTQVTVDLSATAPVSSTTFDLTGTANEINGNYTFEIDPPTAGLGGASDVTVTWTSDVASGSFVVLAGDLSTTYDVDGMNFSLSAVSGPFTGGTFTVTTDADGNPSENVSSYTLTDLVNDINTAVTAAGGGVTASVVDNHLVITPDSEDDGFAFSNDNGSDSGLAAVLGLNTLFTGTDSSTMDVNDVFSDSNLIPFAQIDQETGGIASGDNSNALLVAAIQDMDLVVQNWTFERGASSVSSSMDGTSADIFQTLVSAVGTETKIVGIQVESYENIVEALQAQRDGVSAVSLDEEVINLTRYQTAYEAASKLLGVLDEMLNSILALR